MVKINSDRFWINWFSSFGFVGSKFAFSHRKVTLPLLHFCLPCKLWLTTLLVFASKGLLVELCRLHMHDLKDVTNNVHYENFRYSHLATVTSEGQKTKPVTTSKWVIKLFNESLSNMLYIDVECSHWLLTVAFHCDILCFSCFFLLASTVEKIMQSLLFIYLFIYAHCNSKVGIVITSATYTR